jgi:methylphosphotriester-DNA--protein-cysteine methyltransferase
LFWPWLASSFKSKNRLEAENARLAQAQAANEFATNLMPLVQAFQNARAVTPSQVASALNARAVSEQLEAAHLTSTEPTADAE